MRGSFVALRCLHEDNIPLIAAGAGLFGLLIAFAVHARK